MFVSKIMLPVYLEKYTGTDALEEEIERKENELSELSSFRGSMVLDDEQIRVKDLEMLIDDLKERVNNLKNPEEFLARHEIQNVIFDMSLISVVTPDQGPIGTPMSCIFLDNEHRGNFPPVVLCPLTTEEIFKRMQGNFIN